MEAIKLAYKGSEITLARVSLEEIKNASKSVFYLVRANGIYSVYHNGDLTEAQLTSVIDMELVNCVGTFWSEQVAIAQDTILGIKNKFGGMVILRVVEDNEQTVVLFLSDTPAIAGRAAFQLPHHVMQTANYYPLSAPMYGYMSDNPEQHRFNMSDDQRNQQEIG